MTYREVIKCLDGKERVFVGSGKGRPIEYCIWKNGKPYGRTHMIHGETLPKFLTWELLANFR